MNGNWFEQKKDPEGSFSQSDSVAKEYYFLATGLAAFLGAAPLGAAFAFGATAAGATGATFSAAR
ncbi:MAG: hypothetical protein A3H24_07905 [Rhodoferax sp. RIFCSPLOWO2_12_FULL_60_11]|nr:MAG: hypothetical protein A3H24_07905 [Rhodoferax sp. RIFCSPLOWO2_12_FULL_60_11]